MAPSCAKESETNAESAFLADSEREHGRQFSVQYGYSVGSIQGIAFYNALKTSLGADVLAKTWNIMPLVSAKIQRHPSFGVWGMKSLHQKNPESQDQDKTAIENSALSLAMFLGQNSRLSEQSL
eukprot:CAMPEP_0117845482 /NCGR_PEP_ID=MMETSP0949-20121206/18307_1 /TAXON_ID=44440 /ORGANISM="Chattonella subsalsa, Strain CCMP2191" /LENGTH=123 /DNA_ID=CAMNT_0005691071 /DNA_START=81 /DNA_END=452 /DNA_ORIENTATION=-